jgi:hypothetical protein
MRTTIRLPDDLLATLRKRAAERGITITALIEESLRASLSARKHRVKRDQVRLTTYGRKGLHPGVDLNDSAALLDVMEREHGSAGR